MRASDIASEFYVNKKRKDSILIRCSVLGECVLTASLCTVGYLRYCRIQLDAVENNRPNETNERSDERNRNINKKENKTQLKEQF